MRDDKERLLDIQEAIEQINNYAVQGREAIASDELLQVWIIHHLQILGEAARSLSEPLRATYSAVPWRKIIGMRHILVHHYFGIDLDIVWSVVEQELPVLYQQIKAILDELSQT